MKYGRSRRRKNMRSEKRPETVVVTGGTAGVGRALVRVFASQGAKITVIARGRERLEETKKEIESLNGRPPVPPIFQPEVAADGVDWASRQRCREVFVGWPTLLTAGSGRSIMRSFSAPALSSREDAAPYPLRPSWRFS